MTQTRLPTARSGRRGRPQYSDTVREHVIGFLRMGMSRKAAAGAAGIHPSTFYDWIDKDEEYRREVEIAEAFGVASYERDLSELRRRSMPPAVRLGAVKFFLERRQPETWRERTQIDVTLPPEAEEARRPIDDLRDELRALGEELLRRGSDRARSDHP